MTTMTLSSKLYWSYAAMALVAVIMGGACMLGLLRVQRSTDEMERVIAKRLFLAGTVSRTSTLLVSLERATLLRYVMKDPAGVQRYQSEYIKTEEETRASLKKITEVTKEAQSIALLRNLNLSLDEAEPIYHKVMTMAGAGDLGGPWH